MIVRANIIPLIQWCIEFCRSCSIQLPENCLSCGFRVDPERDPYVVAAGVSTLDASMDVGVGREIICVRCDEMINFFAEHSESRNEQKAGIHYVHSSTHWPEIQGSSLPKMDA